MDTKHTPERPQGLAIEKAEEAHCSLLIADLRPEDAAEIRALTGAGPEAVLAAFKESAVVYSAFLDGEMVCMFGVAESGAFGTGYPWLLGTHRISEIPMTFLRKSREILEEWLEDWPLLTNVADARNTIHLQWLEWLGFKTLRHLKPFGVEGREFVHFFRSSLCASR